MLNINYVSCFSISVTLEAEHDRSLGGRGQRLFGDPSARKTILSRVDEQSSSSFHPPLPSPPPQSSASSLSPNIVASKLRPLIFLRLGMTTDARTRRPTKPHKNLH